MRTFAQTQKRSVCFSAAILAVFILSACGTTKGPTADDIIPNPRFDGNTPCVARISEAGGKDVAGIVRDSRLSEQHACALSSGVVVLEDRELLQGNGWIAEFWTRSAKDPKTGVVTRVKILRLLAGELWWNGDRNIRGVVALASEISVCDTDGNCKRIVSATGSKEAIRLWMEPIKDKDDVHHHFYIGV
jgi:hypothetical protein